MLSTDDETLYPVPVTNLTCEEVTVENLSMHSADLPAEGEKCVSMKLVWNEPDIAADVTAYHIW